MAQHLRYWLTQRDNNNNNYVLIYFNIFIAQLTILLNKLQCNIQI